MAVKLRRAGSSAGPNGVGAVETVPPREDANGPALPEVAERLSAGGEIPGGRLAHLGEVDVQQDAAELRRAVEDAVRHDPEVPRPPLGQDAPQGETVEDAEGMIRHDDQRPLGRQEVEAAPGQLDPDAVAVAHDVPDVGAPRHLRLVASRPPDEADPPAGVLDQAHDRPAPTRAAGACVADLAGEAGRLGHAADLGWVAPQPDPTGRSLDASWTGQG